MSGAFSSMGAILTFITIIIIVFLYNFKDTLNKKMMNFTFFKRSKKRKVIEAKYHDIFTVIDQVRNKINSIIYTAHGEPDETKSVLIRLMINNQLEATRNELINLIELEDIDTMENQQLKYELVEAIKKVNDEYNRKSYLEFLDLGVSARDSKFLIAEYAKFRDDILDVFIDRAESIATNNVYTTNFHRISSAFEVVAMGLQLIARDSIYTCSQINGRFRKYNDKIKF